MRTIRPTPLDSELVVDCRKEVSSERLRRWLRSERRLVFEIRRTRTLPFTAAHFRLLDEFFSGKERTEFLLNLVLQVTAFASNGAGEWFEAWQGNRLAGLAMMTDSFCDMDMAVFVCSDRTIPGVGDVLHASMIDASRAKGKCFLNLCPSLTEGHARFKRKWGGNHVVFRPGGKHGGEANSPSSISMDGLRGYAACVSESYAFQERGSSQPGQAGEVAKGVLY